MKKLLLLLAFTSVSFAQTTERKSLFKSDLGYEITQSVKESDTTVYFHYSFQNMKYTTITDLGIILISNKADLKTFADKLLEFSEKPKGVEISFEHKKFSLTIYDSRNLIIVRDYRGKFTTFSKEKAKNIANEIYTKIELLKI
jgi:hypothetical protein